MTWLAGARITADALRDNAPRVVDFAPVTVNSAVSTTTADAVGITTDLITFRAGRAYRVDYFGRMIITTSASTEGQFVVRKTNASTTPMLLDSGRVGGDGANTGTWGFYFSSRFVNTSGADITTVLVGCYNRAAGTGGIQLGGSAVTPAFLEISDIGLATDFPSATSMT